MIFYDYIYYRICRWKLVSTRRSPDRASPGTYARRELTILQSFNVSGACLALYYYSHMLSGLDFPLAAHIFMLLIIPCYFVLFYVNDCRYASKKNEKKIWKAMSKRWSGEPQNVRREKGWGIVLSYVLSILFWFYYFMKVAVIISPQTA